MTEYLGAPARCPACGGDIEVNGEYLICTNKYECSAQVVGQICKWLAGCKVKHIGGTTIDGLCSQGYIKSIGDLYSLKKEDVKVTRIEDCIKELEITWTHVKNYEYATVL